MSIFVNRFTNPKIFNSNSIADDHNQKVYHIDLNSKYSSKSVCSLLETFYQGKKVKNLLVNGTQIRVQNFVGFNPKTGLATFWGKNDGILLVDCERIDAITL
ncbi:NAGPA domain-containing protein [Priestia megaterium]|uniref:hypothetical protein n=1 Tax=Priestia TaxID=2800373 RepID=UPI0011B6DDAF|nr:MULTISPECIES: hypothetical protein [Priestia]MBD8114317.1 hypothetical protein [Priestia megaterium]MCG0050893.1 hypothetical protein [Priestia aryabhattai]QDZ88169.1 hypothetical protein D0441_28215 [Priestia megaterium]